MFTDDGKASGFATGMLVAMMMHWFRCHDLPLIFASVVKMQVSVLLWFLVEGGCVSELWHSCHE